MLSIKIHNEFLDLPDDVAMELMRNNPFLTEDIQGEYSLGLSIRYSDKNFRLLQYSGTFTKRNKKFTLDAEIWDNGSFRYAGKLVVNQHQSNMNRIEETVWTGLFTIGASSFLQEIQDKPLRDVDMGGERSFNWTGFNISDGSGGFWQMIHAARVPNAYPYTFYPIYNEGWFGVDFPNPSRMYMNIIYASDNNEFLKSPTTHYSNAAAIAPAIYLSYLLENLFKTFGWTLTGDILNDPGYKKITMQSFRAIKWWNFKNIAVPQNGSPFSNIKFDLADHLPPNMTIGAFLVSLKNRLGWFFDFDSNTKTAYLKSYNILLGSQVKDWTKFIQSSHTAEYQEEDKIFRLVNNIDSGDTYPVVKVIDEENILGVANIAALPTASSTYEDRIAFLFRENQYYTCEFDEVAAIYKWIFYAENIGDYTPKDTNATIESDISTMASGRFQFHSDSRTIEVPVCKQTGNYFRSTNGEQSWQPRFLFYHGFGKDSTGKDYPYASAIDTAWSLPYRVEYGSVNNGVYDVWWKEWLKMLGIQDTRTFMLSLPITELKKFTFSDIIFINNVFFVVQTAKEVLPYAGLIEMKLKRIY